MATKQSVFDCFYNSLNGKGRSVALGFPDTCAYYQSDHPGCAIGCQPEFVEAAEQAGFSGTALNKLPGLTDLCPTELTEQVDKICAAAFPDVEYGFLYDLQKFHDDNRNWDGLNLNQTRVKTFCEQHGLKFPGKLS